MGLCAAERRELRHALRRASPRWLETLDAPTFVVAHGGILRALLHLLAGLPAHDAPHLAVPQDRVILFTRERGADDLNALREPRQALQRR